MMVFCNFLEIKAESKKVVKVKVVPFGVLYSCVKFRHLKMGDPVYNSWESKTQPCYEGNTINLLKQHCEQYLGLSGLNRRH